MIEGHWEPSDDEPHRPAWPIFAAMVLVLVYVCGLILWWR